MGLRKKTMVSYRRSFSEVNKNVFFVIIYGKLFVYCGYLEIMWGFQLSRKTFYYKENTIKFFHLHIS